jgi:hypothetical protein
MYNLINKHIDKILDAIDSTRDISPYIRLVQQLNVVDVSTHAEFQQVYRKYWQLNAARLSENFCQSYFALLESLKGAHDIDIKTVAQQLLEIPTHGDGRHSLQFSFASKLVHMVDHRLPIYDSMVESFYFLPTASISEDTEAKLQRLMASYGFLRIEYDRVLQNGLLSHAIELFRHRLRLGAEYSDNKIIDTLIWRFVGFMRDGAIRDGEVVYG